MSAPNTLGAVLFPMCKCNVVLKCQRDQPRQESQSSEKTTGYEQLYLIYFLWVIFAVLAGKLAPNSVSAVPWQC